MIESIVGGIGVIIGVAIGYLLMKTGLKKQSTEIIESAKKEAEAIKKDKILQAKDHETDKHHQNFCNKKSAPHIPAFGINSNKWPDDANWCHQGNRHKTCPESGFGNLPCQPAKTHFLNPCAKQ